MIEINFISAHNNCFIQRLVSPVVPSIGSKMLIFGRRFVVTDIVYSFDGRFEVSVFLNEAL